MTIDQVIAELASAGGTHTPWSHESWLTALNNCAAEGALETDLRALFADATEKSRHPAFMEDSWEIAKGFPR